MRSLPVLLLSLLPFVAVAQELPEPEKRGDVAPLPGVEPDEEWKVVEDIVALVNDDIITVSDVAEADSELSRTLMADLSGPELEKALDEARKSLLYTLIERHLLVQEAARMYDMDKVTESLVDQFKERQGIKSEEDMSRMLRAQGMSEQELEQRLVAYSVPGFVISAEVTDRLAVSDAEVQAYFQEHQAELAGDTMVSFREIVLQGSGDEVREQADKVAADARSGIDFEELVTQVSQSPSKDRGGLVGPLARSDLAPWLAEVLDGLDGPGTVSDAVSTPYGWLVVRLESRDAPGEVDLESQRARIENLIRQERYPAALETYVRKVWSQSQIEVAERFVDRLPREWQGRVAVRQ